MPFIFFMGWMLRFGRFGPLPGSAPTHPSCLSTRGGAVGIGGVDSLSYDQTAFLAQASYGDPDAPMPLHKVAARGPCDVFDPWVRWERGQVRI